MRDSACTACTGWVGMVDVEGRTISDVALCDRCDRVFASVLRAQGDYDAMTLREELRYRRDIDYYYPRFSILHATILRIRAAADHDGYLPNGLGPELDIPDLRTANGLCTGCTGHYQFYYCGGEPRYMIALCLTCHLTMGTVINYITEHHEVPWFARALSKVLPGWYLPRVKRLLAAMQMRSVPGTTILPRNPFGSRCGCHYDCNQRHRTQIREDWARRNGGVWRREERFWH